MAQLSATNCPKCGAPLEIHSGAAEARCSFCGTLVHNQPPPQPPPPQPYMRPPPQIVVQVQPSGASPAAGIITAVTVAFVVGIFVFVKAMAHKPMASTGSTSAISAAAGILGGGERVRFDEAPMLADANGDGVPDVIGHAQWDSDEYLAAFEGATGKVLWKTKAAKEASRGKNAIVGDLFLAVDELGKVQATRIANGTPAWAGLLSDKAESFCLDGTSAIIGAGDKSYTRFDLATGRKSAVDLGSAKHPTCTQVYGGDRETTPRYRIVDWPDFRARNLPELNRLPGMAAHRALVPTQPGISFELGTREPGTQVAMIAAIQDGKLLWKDIVPGIDALSTDVNVTTIMAASDGNNVVIPYGMKSGEKGVRMACFDAKSGKRLWDVQVHKSSNVEHGITVEAGRVYYASWTRLYVLSLQDGKSLYDIGYEF